jgi:hypothetical protein
MNKGVFRPLRNGRSAWFHGDSGTIVIFNPKDADRTRDSALRDRRSYPKD